MRVNHREMRVRKCAMKLFRLVGWVSQPQMGGYIATACPRHQCISICTAIQLELDRSTIRMNGYPAIQLDPVDPDLPDLLDL